MNRRDILKLGMVAPSCSLDIFNEHLRYAPQKPKVIEERRFRILLISQELMLSIIQCALGDYPDCLCLPQFENIPKDVILLNVNYVFEQLAFGFLLAHKSFEKVPPGVQIPYCNTMAWNQYIDLRKAGIKK